MIFSEIDGEENNIASRVQTVLMKQERQLLYKDIQFLKWREIVL